MFLLYVLGVFAISLYGSQCEPQTRETVFTCNSWGDPHIQTWHPKNGVQIQNRDCYVVGLQNLIHNDIATLKANIRPNKYANEVHLVIHNVNDKHHKIFDLTIIGSNIPPAVDSLRQRGVTMNVTTTGTQVTTNVYYEAANALFIFQASNGQFSTIAAFLPQSLADQSTGACNLRDVACTQRGVGTDELEWQPVRSGSTKQIFTNEQAESICNEHIDAFFAKIHRAPYQRNAHVNSVVANVLAGCIADVVLTGEIEAAQAGIEVLMMDELTKDATTVADIQAAVQAGIQEASVLVHDAVKMANARVRRFI